MKCGFKNKKKCSLSKSAILAEVKHQNAFVYIAVSFIHSFVEKPMDMNHSHVAFSVVYEEKGNHFENVLKAMCSNIRT